MNKAVLQVPINASLRKSAEEVALEEGFSSLQEAVRLFLAKYAKRQLSFSISETVQLSPKAIKRYNKIIDDIDSGKEKSKSFDNVDQLMKYLDNR